VEQASACLHLNFAAKAMLKTKQAEAYSTVSSATCSAFLVLKFYERECNFDLARQIGS
jgi:hypothetical protein